MAVIQINEQNFQHEALESELPVLVDFYADWCGPCKMLAPTVEEIARENEGLKVCKLNVDDAPEISARYGVTSIPTLLLFRQGKEAGRSVGVQSKRRLLSLLES